MPVERQGKEGESDELMPDLYFISITNVLGMTTTSKELHERKWSRQLLLGSRGH